MIILGLLLLAAVLTFNPWWSAGHYPALAKAYDDCKQRALALLQAPPTSAAFPASPTKATLDDARGVAYIAAHVDVENSFGASKRTRFGCDLRRDESTWRVTAIRIGM